MATNSWMNTQRGTDVQNTVQPDGSVVTTRTSTKNESSSAVIQGTFEQYTLPMPMDPFYGASNAGLGTGDYRSLMPLVRK